MLCMKALKLSFINKHCAGGLLCPSYPDFKKDVYPTLLQILFENKIRYEYHKTDKTFMFPWSRAPLYIFTAEKPIAGPNLAYCLINEYSLMPFDRISEMMRRVRVKSAKCRQRVLAGTPEDKFFWLEDFIESQENAGDFRIVYADTSENTYIDPDYRKELETMLDDEAIKVFASGQIIRIGGDSFYYSFQRKKNVNMSIAEDKDQVIHVGLDFNVGNMSASFSQKIRCGDHYEQHFFDELVLKGDSNTYDICKAIKARYPIERILITCDASGNNRSTAARGNVRSDVGILRTEGFAVRFKSSNVRLRKRQLLLNGLFDKGHIKIHPSCKLLIKDFEKVQQNKKDFAKVKDKDDKLTHLSDGADYVIDYEYKLDFEKRKSTSYYL